MVLKCKHLRNEKTIFFQWQTEGLPLNFPNIFSLSSYSQMNRRNETKHCGKFKDFFIDAPLWTTALGVEWSIFHVGISFAIKNRPTHAEGCVQSNKYSHGMCRFNLLPFLGFIIHLMPCGLLFHPFLSRLICSLEHFARICYACGHVFVFSSRFWGLMVGYSSESSLFWCPLIVCLKSN